MENTISKELINSVMNYNDESNRTTDNIKIKDNKIEIYYSHPDFGEDLEAINIHELANVCKEWAYNKEIIIESAIWFNAPLMEKMARAKAKCNNEDESPYFIGLSEPEAIFKACQWILDNKDKK